MEIDPYEYDDKKEIMGTLFKAVDYNSTEIIQWMGEIRRGEQVIDMLSNGFCSYGELEFRPDVEGLWQVSDHEGGIMLKTDTWLAAAMTVVFVTTKIGLQMDEDAEKLKSDKRWHDGASLN